MVSRKTGVSLGKVLIVDDDEFFRSMLRMIAEPMGHKVFEAPNGKIAQDLLFKGTFDLVISDLRMPYLTGMQLLEWVRENRKIPFVMMTGFSSIQETQRAHELGAAAVLMKPFDSSAVIQILEEYLQPGMSRP